MKKALSNLLTGAVLVASLTQTAYADVIASADDFTFNWTAICGDCNSRMGEYDEGNLVEVSGSFVLKDYTLGEAFIIDDYNLVSFSYNGPSIHLDAFTLENDNNAAASAGMFEEGIYGVSGSISDDLSSFELDFFHTLWHDEGNTGFDEIIHGGGTPTTMNIHFSSDASWTFDNGILPMDFGIAAAIAPAGQSPVDVPEPSTLAIFALALMGLVSRKMTK